MDCGGGDAVIEWVVVENEDDVGRAGAGILLDTIGRNPHAVLGLPTGRTPLSMYASVVARCRIENHCFRDVVTFNLDEYVGLTPSHPSSYHSYMRSVLFDHVDIDVANVHIPDGTGLRARQASPAVTFDEALEIECRLYEESIAERGPLEVTFLGLGRNGHIGFNEPGTSFQSRTHVITLTESTRAANAPYFSAGETPERAITVGIGTILESTSIVLMAAGEGKREAVNMLRSGDVSEDFPASALHRHPAVRCIVDRAAFGSS